jgi:hypothetical protein
MKRRSLLSYSTKHHLKRVLIGIDWLFLGALLGFTGLVVAVIWFF